MLIFVKLLTIYYCLKVSFYNFVLLLYNRDKDKTNLFTDESLFPMVQKRKKEIKDVEKEMSDHRRTVRLILKQPAVDYVTVLGTEVKKN